jgi:hypothetical protein
MINKYKKDPFTRFQVTNIHNVGFWGFVKGAQDSGCEKTIRELADSYARKFMQLDIDAENLEKGYYKLTKLCIDLNKSN